MLSNFVLICVDQPISELDPFLSINNSATTAVDINPSVALPANWEALRDLNCIQNAVEMTCPIIWQFAGNSNADSYSAFRV